jgi:hypothetical protein
VTARVFVNGFPARESVTATFEKADVVRFDPGVRLFTNSVPVVISTTINSGQIRFTTDGSNPGMESRLYTEPVTIREATTFRARVFLNAFPVSEIHSASFLRVYALDDGIPAAWRERYFGMSYLTDPRAAANADPDGDGVPNLQEFAQGSDPLDPLSGFAIGIRMVPEIRWHSVPGTVYRIVRKNDFVGSPPVTLISEFRATGSMSTYLDPDAPSEKSFYLIEVVPSSN